MSTDERKKPVPKTTGEKAQEITDRRMNWPAFNLMSKDFKEYIQTSTGGFKDELMDMLRETNNKQLKNVSTIRQVLTDLKTEIRKAESIGDGRLRKLKNKQVWDMVDEAGITLEDCRKATKMQFFDIEALLNMWEDQDESMVIKDHIYEEERIQNATAEISLEGLIEDCKKTCGERKSENEPESKFKSVAETENKWYSKPGKTK